MALQHLICLFAARTLILCSSAFGDLFTVWWGFLSLSLRCAAFTAAEYCGNEGLQ